MKNLNIKTIVGILLIGILTTACGSSGGGGEDEHGHEGHGGHEEHGEEGTVSLTEQQMDAIELNLVNLEKRNMTLGVQTTGNLELSPQDRADVSPIMGGVIKEIRVIEGDKVKKGQVLGTLEHPDFIQLQQDYVNNINNLEYLEKEFERQKKLYEEKVGSGKEFQKISSEYKSKKSTVKALKVKLAMLGLNTSKIEKGTIFSVVTVTSPLNGVISLVETNVGAYVAPLTRLFEVVNIDKLHVDFRVYEKDINKVSVGQKVFFSTSSILDEEYEGEIFAISPVFEQNPKALHVHATIIKGNKNLKPGMYVQGRIVAENILTTVLPEHAIIGEEDKSFIFVKTKGKAHDHEHENNSNSEEHAHDSHGEKEDNHGHEGREEGKWTFKKTEVITGISSNGFIEVKLLEPLPAGAEIAGSGAYYLLAEMGKGETAHTH